MIQGRLHYFGPGRAVEMVPRDAVFSRVPNFVSHGGGRSMQDDNLRSFVALVRGVDWSVALSAAATR